MRTIRILLADDHRLVRQGLRSLLEEHSGFKVIGEASDGEEALQVIEQDEPDIVLMDIMMPRLNGLETTRQIRQHKYATRVVILSMHADSTYAVRALREGALGYVLKDSDQAEIVQAIRDVMDGRRYISPKIADDVFDALLSPDMEDGASIERLSSREKQILQLIVEGHTNASIAYQLWLSERTLENHRASLMRKLNVHSQAKLIRVAIQNKLVSLDEPE
ncbi:MAG: response regulator [Chloroflexota bacterium]